MGKYLGGSASSPRIVQGTKKSSTPPGVKHDGGKVMGQLLGDFSRALIGVATVGTFGAQKYTRGGWQTVPDGEQRYYDALWRHLLQANQEPVDSESGLDHLEHAAWNILAVIELRKRHEQGSKV